VLKEGKVYVPKDEKLRAEIIRWHYNVVKSKGSGLNIFLFSFLFSFQFIFFYSIFRTRVRVRVTRSCCYIAGHIR